MYVLAGCRRLDHACAASYSISLVVNLQLQLLLSADRVPTASERNSRVQTRKHSSVCFGAFNA
jgi:hypothetical protein